jgi:hypothetical protein
VSVAANATRVIAIRGPPPVARPPQRRIKLANDQLFDESAHPLAQRALNRVEPIVEKMRNRLVCRLRNIGLRGIARHGVVSGPALKRRMIRG